MKFRVFVLTVGAILGWAVTSNATLQVSDNGGSKAFGTYAPSATDIGDQSQGAVATYDASGANSALFPGSGPATLVNDGLMNGSATYTSVADAFMPHSGSNPHNLIISLDLAAHPLGYNVRSIDAFLAATTQPYGASPGFYIYYTTVSDPTVTLLTIPGPVGVYVAGQYNNANTEMKATVDDSLGGYIINQAATIQISFSSFGLSERQYREFDIFGDAITTPEPTSLGLLLVGGLLCWRKRNLVNS